MKNKHKSKNNKTWVSFTLIFGILLLVPLFFVNSFSDLFTWRSGRTGGINPFVGAILGPVLIFYSLKQLLSKNKNKQ